MGIEDIQISEDLETNAPSIKYRGNEGPKSPQDEQRMKMAQLEEAYEQYVDEMIEMGNEPMSMEQFLQQVMAEGQMAGGPPLPNDPTEPVNPFGPKPMGPVLPDRQMAAYGGIMGIDGRRQYGLGSKFKKFVRKIIPNEVAAVAEKAAPFIALAAPQFALPAAIAGGLGSFDRTGRIGSSLASGLQTYSLGQLSDASGLAPFKNVGPSQGMFSKAGTMGGKYNLSNMLAPKIDPTAGNILGPGGSNPANIAGNTSNISLATGDGSAMDAFYQGVAPKPSDVITKTKTGNILKTIKDFALDNKLLTGLAAGTLGATALMGNMKADEIQDLQRGEGLDIEGIRAEVIEAFKDESGEKLAALRSKYPFLGNRGTKDIDAMGKAMGGRIGYRLGDLVSKSAGVFQPTSDSMSAGNAPSFEGGSGMGGMIADLIRKNPQMFSGGQNNSPVNQNTGMGGMFSKFFRNPRMYDKDFIDENFNYIDDREEAAMGGRIGYMGGGMTMGDPRMMAPQSRMPMEEGGIMDLGGMEKDYRAEGGFVPIGKAEKADDVPARLSVNEFVFTADAVRNAGGGDIDRGAEVMENMMKNLEAGGQVSEESQGMQGARDMFATSQRLSEVI